MNEKPSFDASLPVVSDTLLNLVLLDVIPGKENKVYKLIKGMDSDLAIFLGLDSFEFVVLTERNDFDLLYKFRALSDDSILNICTLPSFKWVLDSGEPESFINNGSALSLSFVRLGKCHLKMSQTTFEREVVRSLYAHANAESLNVNVYGTLESYDLVSILQSPRLEDIIGVRQKFRDWLCIPDKENKQLVQEAVIIPCVDFRLIRTGEFDKLTEEVDSNLFLTLSELDSKTLSLLREESGGCREDLLKFHSYLANSHGSVGSLLKRIRKIRAAKKTLGRSATILLSRESLPTEATYTSPRKLRHWRPQFDIKSAIVNCEPSITTEIGDFLYYYNLYESVERDPYRKETFVNMYPLFEDLYNLLLRGIEARNAGDQDLYVQAISSYVGVIDCLENAFSQRNFGDGFATVRERIRSVFLRNRLRAIQASEAIPAFLSNLMGLKWSGICVVGYVDRFASLPCGIINVPKSIIEKPEYFWGIFHETGHEALYLLEKNKPELYNEIVRSRNLLVNSLSKESEGDAEEQEAVTRQVDHFISEIFADLYDYHFGFWDNWKLYVDTVWTYLAGKYLTNMEYIIRLALVYLALGPGKNEDAPLDQVIPKCLIELEVHANIKLSRRSVARAKHWIKVFFETAKILSNMIARFDNMNLRKEELVQIRERLSQGDVIQGEAITPVATIRALLIEPHPCDCTSRISALLTLYNYAMTHRDY